MLAPTQVKDRLNFFCGARCSRCAVIRGAECVETIVRYAKKCDSCDSREICFFLDVVCFSRTSITGSILFSV